MFIRFLLILACCFSAMSSLHASTDRREKAQAQSDIMKLITQCKTASRREYGIRMLSFSTNDQESWISSVETLAGAKSDIVLAFSNNLKNLRQDLPQGATRINAPLLWEVLRVLEKVLIKNSFLPKPRRLRF